MSERGKPAADVSSSDEPEESRSVLERIVYPGIVLLVSVFVAVLFFGTSYDDAFITYRYSYNLASGNGFVYNVGERFLGTSAPLFGLLVGVLSLPNPEWVPIVGGLLCSIALVAASYGMYLIGLRADRPFAGVCVAVFFALHPLTGIVFSGEMLPLIALVVTAYYQITLQRFKWAGLLLALGVMVRPDALVAAAVGLGFGFLKKRSVPWQGVAVFVGLVGVFFVSMFAYFGTMLPTTMASKQAQVASGLWRPFYDVFMENLADGVDQIPILGIGTSLYATFFYVLAVVGLFAVWDKKGFAALFCWSVSLGIVYKFVGLPYYHWYALPVVLAFPVLAGLGLDLVARRTRKDGRVPAVLWSFLVLFLTMQAIRIKDDLHIASLHLNEPRKVQHEALGKWIAERAEVGDAVGHCEIGYLGYFSKLKVIDTLGLVNPGIKVSVINRDFTKAFETNRPRFIVMNPLFGTGDLNSFINADWFKREYRPASDAWPEAFGGIIVYERT